VVPSETGSPSVIPSETTSPVPSVSASEPTPGVSGSVVTTQPGGVGGAQLPVTGARLALLAGIAFALLLFGGVLLALTRRRTMLDGPRGDGPSHR
jgi:hypothetical protein